MTVRDTGAGRRRTQRQNSDLVWTILAAGLFTLPPLGAGVAGTPPP